MEELLKIINLMKKCPLKEITNELENSKYLDLYYIVSNFYINNPELSFLNGYLDILSKLIYEFEQKQNYLK